MASSERDTIKAWVRHGDDQMLALAGELWRVRVAVDEAWLIRFVKEHDASLGDAEAEWSAQQLTISAKEAGLLTGSTDDTVLELGPMVFVVGRIVTDFELSETLEGRS